MQKSVRPVNSLSQLLKNIYVNGPGNHFKNASHVLPIILLQSDYQKLAFFYQFKDNHIYNFDYDGTFIDELIDNGCILEMG